MDRKIKKILQPLEYFDNDYIMSTMFEILEDSLLKVGLFHSKEWSTGRAITFDHGNKTFFLGVNRPFLTITWPCRIFIVDDIHRATLKDMKDLGYIISHFIFLNSNRLHVSSIGKVRKEGEANGVFPSILPFSG